MSESDKPEEEIVSETPETTEAETTETTETTDATADPNGPVNPDHTDSDIELDVVKKFILGSFVVCIEFFVLMLIVHRFYKGSFVKERGVATAEERQIPGEGDALLQTLPLQDKAEYLSHEAGLLNTKTNAGVHAVIPVEAAKQLMLEEGFAHAEPAEESPVPVADVSGEAAPEKPVATEAKPMEVAVATTSPVAAPAPALDPAMVAAGKKIWEMQCMAACHTGKRGAIAPNIEKAFGTMRKLEGGQEILMDTAYVINSMNNPNEHVARGYMPVMMSFKDILTEEQKKQVAAYLQSQGKAIPVPVVEPAVAETPAQPAPAAPVEVQSPIVEVVPVVEAQPITEVVPVEAPAVPAPAVPAPAAPAPAAPAPAPAATPAPVPAAPTPVTAPAGTIFV